MKNQKPEARNQKPEQQIKSFGIGFSIIVAVFALRMFLRHRLVVYNYLMIISPIILCLAVFRPLFLKPLYKIFSGIGLCIGWLVNKAVLIIIFYLVFAPVGLLLRLIRKDLLDRKIEPQRDSYWLKKECVEFDKSRYAKQY